MNNDWIELLELLAAHRVEFLVVGAWAMAHHGQPRYTAHLDPCYRPSVEGALKTCARQVADDEQFQPFSDVSVAI